MYLKFNFPIFPCANASFPSHFFRASYLKKISLNSSTYLP